VTSPTESNAVFEALGIPAEERLVKQYDRGENHTGYTPLEGYVPPEQRTAAAAESAPAGLGAYAAPTMDAPVSDSAPSTPVFDATVDAPIAPQMSVPPKTDSMPQGPRPSTTGGTQVNIAGNIYAVLDDGSVIDQTGRTPPPPVAELARTKAVSMAREPAPSLNQAPAADTAIYGGGVADGVTYDSAAPSGLAALSPDTMPTVDGPFAYPESRFSTNLGPRAMLDWEEGQAEEAARTNADLGSGRTPRYDTAIGPQPTSPQTETPIDLEAYLKSIYPDYGQEDARTPRYDTAIGPQPAPPEFIPWDKTGKNKENFGRFGQYEAGMDYLLSKARDVISDPNLLESLSEPYNPEAAAGLAARKATRENAQQASVDKLKGIVDQLADPNLDPNLRRALEVQLATERALVGFGQGIDAVPEFLTKYGAAPVTRAAATAVSPFSPTTGANMYNFANTLTNSAEQPRTLTPAELERESIYSSLDAAETPLV
jgi:hypothetical protein